MLERLRNIKALKSLFEKFISEQEVILAKLDKALNDDILRHFLSSHGMSLQVSTVYADESRRFMRFIEEPCAADDGGTMTDEAKFEIIRGEVQRRVLGMNTRLTSRSTSQSSNNDEDAERMFWIDLFKAFNGGY
jgi:hypothetical protein